MEDNHRSSWQAVGITGACVLQPIAGGCRAPGVPQLRGETAWGGSWGSGARARRSRPASGRGLWAGAALHREAWLATGRAGGIGDDGAGCTHRDAGSGSGTGEEPCGEQPALTAWSRPHLHRPVPVLPPAPGWLMPATGLDSAANPPHGARYRFKFPLPWDGTGRRTVPARFPLPRDRLGSPPPRSPPLPPPTATAPGTGKEGGQEHQHRHQHGHVRDRNNGGGRGGAGETAAAGRGVRHGRGGAGRGGSAGAGAGAGAGRRWGRLGVEDPGDSRRSGKAPGHTGGARRGVVGPAGLEVPGQVGKDVLSSHLWAWGGGRQLQRHLRGWRRSRDPPSGCWGDEELKCPNAVIET